jgi:hypothetical protein
MLCHVALVRTDVSEEHGASIITVTRISELGTTLAVTSNQRMLRRNTMFYLWCLSLQRAPLLVTANNVPSSSILVNLMMVAIHSSETSVLTTAPRRNIPEVGILHNQRHENLKSDILYTVAINLLSL